MADVFISYKHQDRGRAEMLADRLSRSAFSVWWDRDLVASEGFRQVIRRELNDARCVVVLWSVWSVDESGENFVLDEATAGRDKLLQVCLDAVSPPMGYGQTQRVSLDGWSGEVVHGGYQDLLRGLSLRLGRPFTSLTPQRRALLVGIEHYAHRQVFPVVGSPIASAEALARALAAAPGGGFKTQLLPDAPWDALDSALKTLTQQTATNDLALLYFAGHATLTREDGLCLCAADTKPDSLDRTGIPLSWLSRKIVNALAAEHVAVILDCDCNGEIAAVERQIVEDLGHGKGKHVVARMVPVGAPGDGASRRGAFSRALADGLSTFAADASRDGILTLDEWFEHATLASAADGALTLRRSFDVPAGAVEIARRPVSADVPAPAQVPNPEALDRVQKALRRNTIVPFIGDGIYGGGPLSGFQIVRALASGSHALRALDQPPLATVAEYHVETGDDRQDFLQQFEQVLADQMTRSKPRLVHDFVLSLASPWLVISTTYDWLLEERLAEAGRPFAVVSHVLRSQDGSRDGSLAVVRFGSDPRFETCLADQLLLESADNVIYKVLGSPFLHRYADPALRIDTVVITENDHSTFLARLDNQAMRVPTAFSRPLQTRQLLFLGYNLDVWHYRLVGHIFRKDGPAPAMRAPFAVRQPTSAMEESFWKRLGADMIKTDADTFVTALQGQQV